MTYHLTDWSEKGFASSPELKEAPDQGIIVYRFWGGISKEWPDPKKGGYFSRTKPRSMLDAELRFNIALWGNRILFVSTFRICRKQKYWEGSIFNPSKDIYIQEQQIFIDPPVAPKVRLLLSKEIVPQDFHIPPPARDPIEASKDKKYYNC